jgi:hypothetical protein
MSSTIEKLAESLRLCIPFLKAMHADNTNEIAAAGKEALTEYDGKVNDPRRMPAIVAAQEEYAIPSDDNIEIDDDAMIADSGDGIWVQAWVYVRNEDIKS